MLLAEGRVRGKDGLRWDGSSPVTSNALGGDGAAYQCENSSAVRLQSTSCAIFADIVSVVRSLWKWGNRPGSQGKS